MTAAKIYEVEGYRFEFTQKGDPFKGILVTRFPELEPYTAEVNLTKPSSCEGYARRAANLHGMSRKGLERALTILYSRRYEEVEVAAEAESGLAAEEPEELPEVAEEEIDALVGRPGVLRRFVTDAARIHGVVGEKAPSNSSPSAPSAPSSRRCLTASPSVPTWSSSQLGEGARTTSAMRWPLSCRRTSTWPSRARARKPSTTRPRRTPASWHKDGST